MSSTLQGKKYGGLYGGDFIYSRQAKKKKETAKFDRKCVLNLCFVPLEIVNESKTHNNKSTEKEVLK